jgi:hypothetical protein
MREQPLLVGRLLNHGRDHYQFRSQEDESYFVKLSTPKGERVVWGKDLERAVASASTQPKLGDVVGVKRLAREPVTITTSQRNGAGQVIAQREQEVFRNRWVVEKVQFFAERSQLARRVRDDQVEARRAVKAHPELMSTYLTLRGAQEIAQRRIADPKDREKFVALVREAMAGSIKRGDPLPVVRLRKKTEVKERPLLRPKEERQR